jgi:hypothetical protein
LVSERVQSLGTEGRAIKVVSRVSPVTQQEAPVGKRPPACSKLPAADQEVHRNERAPR